MSGALTPSAAGVLVGIAGALAIGSTIRVLALWSDRSERARRRRESLRTWWLLVMVLAAAVLLGAFGVCLLLAVTTWLGFAEYRALEATAPADRFAARLLALTIPLVYVAIYLGWGLTALYVLPLVSVLLVATSDIVHGVTGGYVRSIGSLVFGAVVLIGGLGHAAEMVVGAGAVNSVGGSTGWFILLVVLTETSDIAQALVGRRLGRHRVTPAVSPHKTWEGLVGGAAVTMAASVLLAPLLTPLADHGASGRLVWPAFAGLLVTLGGFLGDLNISAVKRDADVKDSSTALPGMGGVLDRIDSLTLAAPVFYWLVVVPAS